MNNEEVVTASEISEYLYCKRGWYLRFTNQADITPNMLEGIRRHESLFLLLGSLAFRKRVARFIILLSLILFGISLVVLMLEYIWI